MTASYGMAYGSGLGGVYLLPRTGVWDPAGAPCAEPAGLVRVQLG